MEPNIQRPDKSASPETSIILRTFNEERYVPGLLEAVSNQQYQDFEIVNVDSGSYDKTLEIVREHGAVVTQIESRDFTFGYSLNVGIEAARGQFMVIVSAHTEPVDDTWLGKLVEPLRDIKNAMVYGRQLGVDSSKFGEIRDLRRTFGNERKVLEPPNFFANNANSAIRRDLWIEHPFDPDLTGQEDIEWAKYWMEKGYGVVYEPDAPIYHIHHESWRQVRHRYYREALATRNIGVWKQTDAVSLAINEVSHMVGDFLEASKTHKIIERTPEILRFRYNKAYGTVAGLLDGEDTAREDVRERLYFDRKCQAVVIHGKEQAEYREVDMPRMKPGDVLVKVAFAGVTNADVGMFAGDSSYFDGGTLQFPAVPGREITGWVADVGARVTNVTKGTPVVVQTSQTSLGCGECQTCLASGSTSCEKSSVRGDGGYAEFVVVPSNLVHPLPANTEMKNAMAVYPLSVGMKAIRKLEHVLNSSLEIPNVGIIGAGPIGHTVAQVLAAREHSVTIMDKNPKRLEYFDGTSVSTRSDRSSLDEHNVLIEATGDPSALQHMMDSSKPGATLMLLGLPYSERQFAIQGRSSVDKTMIWSVGAGHDDMREAVKVLNGVPTRGLTERVFPMSQFRQAWEGFRRGDDLKILLDASS